MSFFNKPIVLYPNLLNYDSSDIDSGLNYDPSAEPSITGDSYTSSGGETTGGAYDLTDGKLGSTVSIEVDTTSNNVTIDFDLTSNVTADSCVIGNTNFNAAAVLTVGVLSGSSPAAVTMNNAYAGAQNILGYWTLAAEGITSNEMTTPASGVALALFTKVTATNNYQVTLTGGPYDDDVTIGEISFCESWTAPHSPETQGFRNDFIYGSNVSRSKAGKKYGTFYHGERKGITLPFQHLTQAQHDALAKVFRITKGDTYPLWVDLGEHATLPYLRFMRLVGDFTSVPIAGGTYHNVTITLEDE